MNEKPILFLGDPHMNFETAKAAAASYEMPGTIVCVGDFELPYPIRSPEVFGGLFAAGWQFLYVIGNHDTDTCQQFDYLDSDMGVHHWGNPHRKVAVVDGVRIAGLGGVFKGRIWSPGGDPRFASRAAWMNGHRQRWLGGLPLHLVNAIFPENFELLARQRADILVCHEGPSSVGQDMGWTAIDDLAHRMGCGLIVHGHHHFKGTDVLPNGVGVKSLDIAEVWELPG